MKKGFLVMSSAVLSIAFLAMSLTALMLPEVKGGFYGEYTIHPNAGGTGVYASRCDHWVQPPSTQDAWTGCGIEAIFGVPFWGTYSRATYYFNRGYGGVYQQPHTWTTDSYMYCFENVDSSSILSIETGSPTWSYTPAGWWAYYHIVTKTLNPIQPTYNGYTVGATTYSYFKEVANPTHRILISSTIYTSDMYATHPNWRDR